MARNRNRQVLPVVSQAIPSAARNPAAVYGGGIAYSNPDVLWEWNKKDLSQFGTPVDINGGIALGSGYAYEAAGQCRFNGTLDGIGLPMIRWTPAAAGAATYKGLFLPITGLSLPSAFEARITVDTPNSTSHSFGLAFMWQSTANFWCIGRVHAGTNIQVMGHDNVAASAITTNMLATRGSITSVAQNGVAFACTYRFRFLVDWTATASGKFMGLPPDAGDYGAISSGAWTKTNGATWNHANANQQGLVLYHSANAAAGNPLAILELGFYKPASITSPP